MRYIGKFGTGIKRVKQAYNNAIIHPEFKVYPNSIAIVLPVLRKDTADLSQDEKIVYQLLLNYKSLTRKEVEDKSGLSKAKTIRILNKLIDKNSIEIIGQGRSTNYRAKN